MPNLLVRNLDKETIDRLKKSAAAKRRSLQQEVRDILTKVVVDDVVPLTGAKRAAALDRIRAMQAKPTTLLSEDLVREDRSGRLAAFHKKYGIPKVDLGPAGLIRKERKGRKISHRR